LAPGTYTMEMRAGAGAGCNLANGYLAGTVIVMFAAPRTVTLSWNPVQSGYFYEEFQWYAGATPTPTTNPGQLLVNRNTTFENTLRPVVTSITLNSDAQSIYVAIHANSCTSSCASPAPLQVSLWLP